MQFDEESHRMSGWGMLTTHLLIYITLILSYATIPFNIFCWAAGLYFLVWPRSGFGTASRLYTATNIPFTYFQKRNCVHVSVSDLYFPSISPHIFLQQNRQTDGGINIKITHRHMNVEIETVAAQFLFLEYLFQIFGIVSLQYMYGRSWGRFSARRFRLHWATAMTLTGQKNFMGEKN